MESALELCRASNHREGMIVVLSNLGCLYNLLERSHYAVGHFQECFDLLEGDPSGQGEAQVWRLRSLPTSNGARALFTLTSAPLSRTRPAAPYCLNGLLTLGRLPAARLPTRPLLSHVDEAVAHVRGQRRQLRSHRALPAVPQAVPAGARLLATDRN